MQFNSYLRHTLPYLTINVNHRCRVHHQRAQRRNAPRRREGSPPADGQVKTLAYVVFAYDVEAGSPAALSTRRWAAV